MSIAWIAGAIRGAALARRAPGEEEIRHLAEQPSLTAALRLLATSTYGRDLKPELELEEAQRTVAGIALWHLRVLAGWLPAPGVTVVRVLAGWFELINLEELAVAIETGGRSRPAAPYNLGALATIHGPLADAASLSDLRRIVARSEWGDPGGDALPVFLLGLRLGWARRLRQNLREHPEWGDGALALAVAIALFLHPEGAAAPDVRSVPELGTGWRNAGDIRDFAARLPPSARWVFNGVESPVELWRAELVWWERLRSDAMVMLRHSTLGRTRAVGAAVLLLTDAWSIGTALARAARGAPATEVTRAPT